MRTWAALVLWCLANAGTAAAAPFKTEADQTIDYVGPGRDEPEPDVADVRIAWFGPAESATPGESTAHELWQGALLAQEEENAAGGYHGKPFRLIPAWSNGPWGAAVVSLTQRVFDDRVWAVIGGLDGATSHLAEQVAVKVGLPVVSPGSTDPSVHAASSPWMFSLPPDDDRQAIALAGALAASQKSPASIVIAATTDHDAHVALRSVQQALAFRQLTPGSVVLFASRDTDDGSLAERLLSSAPRAIVIVAAAEPAGRLASALRRARFSGLIAGPGTLATGAFRRAAGSAADGVIVPLLIQPGGTWASFAQRYARRFDEPADASAGYGYDALRLVAAAVRRSGLNRVRLLDALRSGEPHPGVTGSLKWDARGRSVRSVSLGVWDGGAVVPR